MNKSARLSCSRWGRTIGTGSLIATLALSAFAIGCGAATHNAAGEHAKPFHEMTIETLEGQMEAAKSGKAALFIYDNNHKETFEKSHIPGAKWVAYDDVKATDLPEDKAATLVFYCANEH